MATLRSLAPWLALPAIPLLTAWAARALLARFPVVDGAGLVLAGSAPFVALLASVVLGCRWYDERKAAR